jgi:uncharacterized membrane protein
MEYLWIKWAHIVSSTVLFGTGIGIAFFKWASDRNADARVQAAVLKIVVTADWCFTTPAVVVQLATGLWLAQLAGLPLNSGWVFWALVLYFVAGACWLPVVWLQIKMHALAVEAVRRVTPLPEHYHRYRRYWFALGVPAFTALLAVFYLMVFKPR